MVAAAEPQATSGPGPLGTLFHISRFHIICIASATSLTFGWLLTGRDLWLAPAVCALDWFLVNLMNRIADLTEDRVNAVVGTDFIDRNARVLTVASVLLLLGSFPAVWLIAPALTLPRLAFQVIGLAYNYRILPSPSGLTRFKETYLFKNSSSAVLFLLSCIVYPLALAGAPFNAARALWLAAFFFPLELTYEVIYDLRDIEGDRLGKVPTFPVVHGEAGAYRIIEGLLTASAAALVVGYAVGALRFRELVLIAGVAQQALFFHFKVKRPAASRPMGPLLLPTLTQRDCVFLTYLGASQVAAYNLWVWAGLPLGPG